MTRTRYEPDFKLRIVREALRTRNASVVARRYNLARNLVACWVRQYVMIGRLRCLRSATARDLRPTS